MNKYKLFANVCGCEYEMQHEAGEYLTEDQVDEALDMLYKLDRIIFVTVENTKVAVNKETLANTYFLARKY